MGFIRTNFNGDPNIGLYGFATDSYCIMGVSGKRIDRTLKVPSYHCMVLNMELIRIFITGNSSGIIMPRLVKDYGSPKLQFDKIFMIKDKYTAIGNLVLMNDKGIIISPLIRKHRKELESFFGIPCDVSTIAKQRIVGNLGIATNKGCLVHPKARKSEMNIIKETLAVDVDIGTVNFGSPYPGAGIIANSNGFVVSESTSGPEMGRITEALGFL